MKVKCPSCQHQFLHFKKIRSKKQNRYYWLILTTFGDELGYSAEEMHILCATRFLKTFRKIKEKFYESSMSTTELTTAEFEDYCSKIRMWASSEFQTFLPLPNEKTEGGHE